MVELFLGAFNGSYQSMRIPLVSQLWFAISFCSVFGGQISKAFTRWVFPKIVVPQNGWFIMENPIKMDDLVVPPFWETPRCSTSLTDGLQSDHHSKRSFHSASGHRIQVPQ